MATRTAQDMAERVLKKVGVLAAGQAASAEDLELVKTEAPMVYASLSARDVFYVPDEDAIEEEAFDILALLVANAVADDFGRAEWPPARIRQAENDLRLIARGHAAKRELTIERFW